MRSGRNAIFKIARYEASERRRVRALRRERGRRRGKARGKRSVKDIITADCE